MHKDKRIMNWQPFMNKVYKKVLEKTNAINSNVLFTVFFKLPDLFIILITHLPAKQ